MTKMYNKLDLKLKYSMNKLKKSIRKYTAVGQCFLNAVSHAHHLFDQKYSKNSEILLLI